MAVACCQERRNGGAGSCLLNINMDGKVKAQDLLEAKLALLHWEHQAE